VDSLVSTVPSDRFCPWCGSADTVLVLRGFAGVTDERNQYVICKSCERQAYEMIALTAWDMRLGRYQAGGTYTDRPTRSKYEITRVLKTGNNEFLLYVRPIVDVDRSN